jgi:hypothetical protein
MGPEDRFADKIIGFAGSVPADFTRAVARPERRAALFTDLACQPLCLKIFELVFFFEHEKSLNRQYSLIMNANYCIVISLIFPPARVPAVYFFVYPGFQKMQ